MERAREQGIRRTKSVRDSRYTCYTYICMYISADVGDKIEIKYKLKNTCCRQSANEYVSNINKRYKLKFKYGVTLYIRRSM
jgi:hypothetical protein